MKHSTIGNWISILLPLVIVLSILIFPASVLPIFCLVFLLTITQLICTIPIVNGRLRQSPVAQKLSDNVFVQQMNFGLRQLRPFILAGAYLSILTGIVSTIAHIDARSFNLTVVPHSPASGSHHYVHVHPGPPPPNYVSLIVGLLIFLPLPVLVVVFNIVSARAKRREYEEEENQRESLRTTRDAATITITQRKARQNNLSEANFYHSAAFAVPFLIAFGGGLPALLAWWLYKTLGIGPHLHPPASYGGVPQISDLNTFLMYFYLSGLGVCLATLFCRAFWTFPFNFYNCEQDIEFNSDGIRQRNIKGWFSELVWYNWPEFIPKSLSWKDLCAVDYEQSGFGKMSPLPPVLFGKETKIYRSLNHLAELTDACVDKLGRAEYLVFKSRYQKSFGGGGIKIRLWELSDDERLKLYYALRKWAPSLHLSRELQQRLTGSSALSEARYTQIWFDVLMTQGDRGRSGQLEPGDQLQSGRFTIVDRLPSGGQANVYTAKDPGGKLVVIKEFILATGGSVGALVESASDFENEATMLGNLDHQHIVKLVDSFAEERRMYLALEYIEGKSLRQHVKERGVVDESETIRLAKEMSDLLSYIHGLSPPLIHRDFTPDNLVLTADGHLHLIDFSVAFKGKNVKTTEFSGKHAYTPPEQFRGEPCPQSDIYALGATLHFLLTGVDPEPISQSSPQAAGAIVSDALNRIIQKATQLELEDRYESIRWLQLDLDELGRTAPSADGSEPIVIALPRKKKSRSRRK